MNEEQQEQIERIVEEWQNFFFELGDWTPKSVILPAKAYKKLSGQPMNKRLRLTKTYQFGPPKVRKK